MSRGGSSRAEITVVLLCAAALSVAAVAFCASRGYTLYFGDAEAHLNIARRIIDSRTPGPDQIGTVWLPLPHLLTACFVGNDRLWQSGLAGAIPSAGSFIAACVLIYLAARRLFGEVAPAAATAAVFALNPNLLYLQAIPMTEAILFAAIAGMLYSLIAFAQSGSFGFVLLAGAFSNAASMTRYEGWFLIPFIALAILLAGGGRGRGFSAAVLFGAIAAVTPALWLLHNLWYFSNPLEFYNGPYSAKGIYERALKSGGARAPGDGNWPQAAQYFWAAARLCAGTPLAMLGIAGALVAVAKRTRWFWLVLALPPLFYVWSVHSSGANIFVPHLWPNSYYNIRYGTTAMPLFAFGVGSLCLLLPGRLRRVAAVLLVIACSVPWVLDRRSEAVAVWKESEVNSNSRRAWTALAADYLRNNVPTGDGVFAGFGDQTGAFREAAIPIRRILHDGNNPAWNAATVRPTLFLYEPWALALAGDEVETTIREANRLRTLYTLVSRIEVPGAKAVHVYRRTGHSGPVPTALPVAKP